MLFALLLLLRLALMQATDGRDALAKDIYERLFGWLVTVINHSTAVDEFSGASDRTMSLLDIFGFECFKVGCCTPSKRIRLRVLLTLIREYFLFPDFDSNSHH